MFFERQTTRTNNQRRIDRTSYHQWRNGTSDRKRTSAQVEKSNFFLFQRENFFRIQRTAHERSHKNLAKRSTNQMPWPWEKLNSTPDIESFDESQKIFSEPTFVATKNCSPDQNEEKTVFISEFRVQTNRRNWRKQLLWRFNDFVGNIRADSFLVSKIWISFLASKKSKEKLSKLVSNVEIPTIFFNDGFYSRPLASRLNKFNTIFQNLCKKRRKTIREKTFLPFASSKFSLIASKARPSMVLTVLLPSCTGNETNETRISCIGCPITLQQRRYEENGCANQKWALDQNLGFLIPFNAPIVDQGYWKI